LLGVGVIAALVITWSSRKSDFGAQRPLERSMPSGYDKSPDYGGLHTRRWTAILAAMVAGARCGAVDL
jgi:hypothetical protein